jgi:DNA polymerase-4
VGTVAQQQLALLNLATLGDVRRYPRDLLVRRLGKFGDRLADLARGVDPTPVTPHTPAKSVSSESTLDADTDDHRTLHDLLLHHAEDVARQLRKLGLKARTITLKVKHADFQQATRSRTLPRPVQAAEAILAQAEALLQAYPLKSRLRLIGVGASHFVPAATPVQAELFPREGRGAANWEKVDHTLDAIHAKFGRGAIRKATLVAPPESDRPAVRRKPE